MVLHSYGYFCGEGNWSKYVTIRDAFSGDASLFLGSIGVLDDLPVTVEDAVELWELSIDPVIGDTCFVEADSGHGGNPSQFVVGSISNGNITWKYVYSIPIPSSNFQLLSNLVTDFTDADDTHYPSAKAVDDIVNVLSDELALIDSVPNITKVVFDDEVNVFVIKVTLDKPLPTSTHRLTVTTLKTGSVQPASFSPNADFTVWTITTVDPVITPFLVVIEKT
jgi:hypothetical protein